MANHEGDQLNHSDVAMIEILAHTLDNHWKRRNLMLCHTEREHADDELRRYMRKVLIIIGERMP